MLEGPLFVGYAPAIVFAARLQVGIGQVFCFGLEGCQWTVSDRALTELAVKDLIPGIRSHTTPLLFLLSHLARAKIAALYNQCSATMDRPPISVDLA